MLDENTTIDATALVDLVGANRRALLGALSGSAAQWGEVEITAWLAGPYRAATLRADRAWQPPSLAPYFHLVRETFARARRIVTTRMHRATRGEFRFAVDALEIGYVEQVTDGEGNYAFLAADYPSMNLCDRVESLLAADYLTSPSDYEERLSFCRYCTEANFCDDARVRGQCGSHTEIPVRVRHLPCPSKHGTLIALGRLAG